METQAAVTAAPLETFESFRQQQLSMLGYLRKLQELAQDLGLAETAGKLDHVIARTESQGFAIAIVGEFKRGKSTLINALLGRPVLPADVLPCSATLNRVRYSNQKYVEVVFKPDNGHPGPVERIGIEQLADYVTKLTDDSERRAASIQEAIVHYPVPYCEHADIIDTPGLNDDANMTEVTHSVLSQVDAAVLVISALAPFAESESQFLYKRVLMNDIGRVLFVVNRIDHIAPPDRERLLAGIEKRILSAADRRGEELFGKGTEELDLWRRRLTPPQVFGLSAQQALDAKLGNDEALLAASGFRDFEDRLERFIVEERGSVALQVMADSAVTASRDILSRIALQRSGLAAQKDEFDAAYSASSARLEELRQKYRDEMHRVDKAAEKTKLQIRPQVARLGDELRQAAAEAIDSASIQPAELGKQEALVKKLSERMEESTRRVHQLAAERMQFEIQRGLDVEIQRLGSFADELGKGLLQIEMQFASLRPAAQSSEGSTAVQEVLMLPFLAGAPVLGGIFSGYRQAGLKGAAVGGGAGFGAAFGVVFTTLALGLPLTWPVMLVAGAASLLAGKFATKLVFARDRVESFRAEFKKAALQHVDSEWAIQRDKLEIQLDQQVAAAFQALAQHVSQELGGPLEQTQRTLDDIRSRRERSEAQGELEVRQLEDMHLETHRIQAKALALAESLRGAAHA